MKSDAYDRLRAALKANGQPLRVRDLVRIWSDENYAALVKVGFRMMREPIGTEYSVPPLRFTAFTSTAARDEYQAFLYAAVKARTAQVRAADIFDEHIVRLVVWCRGQLENALAGLALEATYHHHDVPITAQEQH